MIAFLKRFLVTFAAVTTALGQSGKPLASKSVAPQMPVEWKAGVASVTVTPERFLFMAG